MFDTHAHYDDDRFDEDRKEVIDGLNDAGVTMVVNVGANLKTSKESIKLADKYSFIFAAVGVHPEDVKELKDDDVVTIKKLAQSSKKVVAIGEIGLDYYYENSERNIQKIWFKKQIDIAKELNLPIIVHSRDAEEDTFQILKKNYPDGNINGILHCYSGSAEMAKEYVKMGLYLGIGGVLTYKNARKTVEVVENIPLENFVIETDCPYLAPDPKRGNRNDSTNLKYVVAKIAEIKGITEEEVIRVTTENGKKVYRID